MILAGDVGGTKTVLGLFEPAGDTVQMVRDGIFPSGGYGSLEEIVAAFLQGQAVSSLPAACFGVAGPVLDGKCRTTNLPWQLDEQVLAAALRVPHVKLLNDLEAAAYGMLFLPPDELTVLNPGSQPPRRGNMAVVAAGTGLGEAILYWDGRQHHPLASEGGHADFAPRTDQEVELLRYLRGVFHGRVSYERVLSGPGLHNVYKFLRQGSGQAEPTWLREELEAGDPNAVVTEAGLTGRDPVCAAAVELFAELYGAEAGNLALKCMAVGGVFVGGGIAPKILPVLQNGSFLRGFTDKGRMSGLMHSIPVRVARNPRAPLIGAAHFALRL